MKFIKNNIIGIFILLTLAFSHYQNRMQNADIDNLMELSITKDSILSEKLDKFDNKLIEMTAKDFSTEELKTLSRVNREIGQLRNQLIDYKSSLKRFIAKSSVVYEQIGSGPLIRETVRTDSIFVIPVQEEKKEPAHIPRYTYNDKFLAAEIYPDTRFMTYKYNPGQLDLSIYTKGLFKTAYYATAKFENPNTTILDHNIIVNSGSKLHSTINAGIGYGLVYNNGSIKTLPTISIQYGIPVFKFWSKKK